jgi:hypothetical protein
MPVRRTRPEPQGLYLRDGSAAAARQLAGQGISMDRWARHPGDDPPDVPRDLTEEPDRALMNLFQAIQRWVKYLALQLAAAEVDESCTERALTRIEALKGYDFRKVDAKTRAYTDQEYLTAKDDQEAAYGYRKMIAALYANVDRDSFHLSRELTRRSARADRDHRAERHSS